MTVATRVSLGQGAALLHVDREDAHDLVAVDLVALGVDGEAAVGVAVVGDADVGALADDGVLEVLEVGRAVAVVDVEAVGLGADLDDVGAGEAEHLGRDRRGRTVGAVDDDGEPVEPVGEGLEQVGDVAGLPGAVLVDPTDLGAGRALPLAAETGVDLVLDRVGELVPAGARRT